jgi:formate dehydrogenase subunit gamma
MVQSTGFRWRDQLPDISGMMRTKAVTLPIPRGGRAEGGGPMNIHVKDDVSERALAIVAEHKHLEGPLLPILHALQADFGYVPEAALPVIARELNLSRAEVHGVVTFYHEFRHHPAGKHVVRICRAEACQSMGGRALADHACKTLDLDWHGTTPDGKVTLEPVYCLGLCSIAPAAQVDGELHGRLDRDELSALLKAVRA